MNARAQHGRQLRREHQAPDTEAALSAAPSTGRAADTHHRLGLAGAAGRAREAGAVGRGGSAMAVAALAQVERQRPWHGWSGSGGGVGGVAAAVVRVAWRQQWRGLGAGGGGGDTTPARERDGERPQVSVSVRAHRGQSPRRTACARDDRNAGACTCLPERCVARSRAHLLRCAHAAQRRRRPHAAAA